MEEKLDLILDYILRLDGEIQDFRKEMHEFRGEVKEEFKEVREQLDRMESDQPNDITALLSKIEKNTNVLSEDLEFLAGKVGKHEMIIDRINKQ